MFTLIPRFPDYIPSNSSLLEVMTFSPTSVSTLAEILILFPYIRVKSQLKFVICLGYNGAAFRVTILVFFFKLIALCKLLQVFHKG